jgi:hypothetical protein
VWPPGNSMAFLARQARTPDSRSARSGQLNLRHESTVVSKRQLLGPALPRSGALGRGQLFLQEASCFTSFSAMGWEALFRSRAASRKRLRGSAPAKCSVSLPSRLHACSHVRGLPTTRVWETAQVMLSSWRPHLSAPLGDRTWGGLRCTCGTRPDSCSGTAENIGLWIRLAGGRHCFGGAVENHGRALHALPLRAAP